MGPCQTWSNGANGRRVPVAADVVSGHVPDSVTSERNDAKGPILRLSLVTLGRVLSGQTGVSGADVRQVAAQEYPYDKEHASVVSLVITCVQAQEVRSESARTLRVHSGRRGRNGAAAALHVALE